MNLADDLRILNTLRVPYKSALIKFVAHLYTHHPNAMNGINGEQLNSIAYFNIEMIDLDLKSIVYIMENEKPEDKTKTLERYLRLRALAKEHDGGLIYGL